LPCKPPDMRTFFDKMYSWPSVDYLVVMVSKESDPRREEVPVEKVSTRPGLLGTKPPRAPAPTKPTPECAFQLLHPTTLKPKRSVAGHTGDVLSACHVPEYDWIVTSGNDRQLIFWEPGFAQIKRWSLDTAIGSLCWAPIQSYGRKANENPGGMLFAADRCSEKIHVWNIKEQMVVRQYEGPVCRASRMKSSATERLRQDPTCQCEQCRMHWELEGHGSNSPAQVMTWIPQMEVLASAALDRTIRLWDMIQHGKLSHEFRGHTKGVTCLEWVPSVRSLLSAGFDHNLSLWDPQAGCKFAELRGHGSSIAGAKVVPDSPYEVVSVDYSGVCKLWDVRQLECVQTFLANDAGAEAGQEPQGVHPRSMVFLGRDRLVVAGRKMVLFERDLPDPKVTSDTVLTSMAVGERKADIFTPIRGDAGPGGAEASGSVRVWSALTGQIRGCFPNVVGANVTALAVDAGSRRLAVGSEKGEMVILNCSSGHTLKVLTPHTVPKRGGRDEKSVDYGEVTQIEFCAVPVKRGGTTEWQPAKIISMCAVAKEVYVHDDTHPTKAALLKKIDASQQALPPQLDNASDIDHNSMGDLRRFCVHLDYGLCSVSADDGTVGWYNVFSGKLEGSGRSDQIGDASPVSCCKFLRRCPLMVTCDSACSLVFWSLKPLPTYGVFAHRILFRATSGRRFDAPATPETVESGPGADVARMTPQGHGRSRLRSAMTVDTGMGDEVDIDALPFGVTCMAVSQGENAIFLSTDAGHLTRVEIEDICRRGEKAAQQAELKARQAKPEDDKKVVVARRQRPTNTANTISGHAWTIEAHPGAIDQLVVIQSAECLLSAGVDQVIRLWSCASGESLGNLHQGVADPAWHPPIQGAQRADDVMESLARLKAATAEAELAAIENAAKLPEVSVGRENETVGVDPGDSEAPQAEEDARRLSTVSRATARGRRRRTRSTTDLHGVPGRASDRTRAAKMARAASGGRLQCLAFRRGGGFEMCFEPAEAVPEWVAPGARPRPVVDTLAHARRLPPLESGLRRGPRFDAETVHYAQRLATAVEGLGDAQLAAKFRAFGV